MTARARRRVVARDGAGGARGANERVRRREDDDEEDEDARDDDALGDVGDGDGGGDGGETVRVARAREDDGAGRGRGVDVGDERGGGERGDARVGTTVRIGSEGAKAASAVLGPLFAVSTILFIVRIVMTWYPSVPYTKLPWVVAYAPTEPLLKPTRAMIPPVGGVDVSPIVWVMTISFMNEILLGKQGLLVLLSNKQLGG